MSIQPIQTWYAGRKFRSRLEARWAVFFDVAGIRRLYEPEGFVIRCPITGTETYYLPDFLLPDCGTWVEVRGNETTLNHSLLWNASEQLPQEPERGEEGPTLLVVGPFPNEEPWQYDWGWAAPLCLNPDPMPDPWPDDWMRFSQGTTERYGFGSYHKNKRPCYLDNATNDQYRNTGHWTDDGEWISDGYSGNRWLTPIMDASEEMDDCIRVAYWAAQSARFEHGERGSVLPACVECGRPAALASGPGYWGKDSNGVAGPLCSGCYKVAAEWTAEREGLLRGSR